MRSGLERRLTALEAQGGNTLDELTLDQMRALEVCLAETGGEDVTATHGESHDAALASIPAGFVQRLCEWIERR
jgi:hypothetical protein